MHELFVDTVITGLICLMSFLLGVGLGLLL